MEWDTAGEDRFRLLPIFLNQYGKIDMGEKAGNQSGREEAMKQTAVKDEIPTQSKKGEGKKVSERLPDDKSGQG